MTQVDAVVDQSVQESGGTALKNNDLESTQHIKPVASPMHENKDMVSTPEFCPNDESVGADEINDDQGNNLAVSGIGSVQINDNITLEQTARNVQRGVTGNQIEGAHAGGIENQPMNNISSVDEKEPSYIDEYAPELYPGQVALANSLTQLENENEALITTTQVHNKANGAEISSIVVPTLEVTQIQQLESDCLNENDDMNMENSVHESNELTAIDVSANLKAALDQSQLDHLNEKDEHDKDGSIGTIENAKICTVDVAQEQFCPDEPKENTENKLQCLEPNTIELPGQVLGSSMEMDHAQQLESDQLNENDMVDTVTESNESTSENIQEDENAIENVPREENDIATSTDIVCPPSPNEGLPMLTRALDAFVQVMTLNGYSIFKQVLFSLGQHSQEYNHKGCEHFGSITTSVLNGKTAYENAARAVYEWCSLTIPLLRGYQRILIEKTSPQAQWKLLWNIATQATIKLQFAQDQLGHCHSCLGKTLIYLKELRENGIQDFTRPPTQTESLFSTEEDIQQYTAVPEKWSWNSLFKSKKNKQKRAPSSAPVPVVTEAALITPISPAAPEKEGAKEAIGLIFQQIQRVIENLIHGRKCIMDQVNALEHCIKTQTGVYDYDSSSKLLIACTTYLSYQK